MPKRTNVAGYGYDVGGKGKGKGKGGFYGKGKGGKGYDQGGKGKGKGGSLLGGGVRGLLDDAAVSVDSELPTPNSSHLSGDDNSEDNQEVGSGGTIKPGTTAASRRASDILSKHSASKATSQASSGDNVVISKRARLADRLGSANATSSAAEQASNPNPRRLGAGSAAPAGSQQPRAPAATAPTAKTKAPLAASTKQEKPSTSTKKENVKAEDVKVLSFAEIIAAKKRKQQEAAAAKTNPDSAASGAEPPSSASAPTTKRPRPAAGDQGSSDRRLESLSVEDVEANLQAALADTPKSSAPPSAEAPNESNVNGTNEEVGDGAVEVPLVVGQRILGQWEGGEDWYNGVISTVHEDDGTYDVVYDDGDTEERKPRHMLAPE